MLMWYLEGYASDGKLASRQALDRSPLVIGRSPDCDIVVQSTKVSRRHAELRMESDQLLLTDLGSTNGTWNNHQRIDGTETLFHGDVVHFGNVEYRVVSDLATDFKTGAQTISQDDMTMLGDGQISGNLSVGARELSELLEQGLVKVLFQPICNPQGEIQAIEALGRGIHPDLPTSPGQLFALAESLGKAPELSELLRKKAVETLEDQQQFPVFLNVHPREFHNPDRLLTSLRDLYAQKQNPNLVLEIHEEVVTDHLRMKSFLESLLKLGIQMAYDDFGAGQARLLELVEFPPKYLKFDGSLVRNLSKASSQKQQMLSALVQLCKDLGIQTLAECVETRKDVEVCQAIDFDLIQGFVFSRPKPWEDFGPPWQCEAKEDGGAPDLASALK